jgi:hypothetical protein
VSELENVPALAPADGAWAFALALMASFPVDLTLRRAMIFSVAPFMLKLMEIPQSASALYETIHHKNEPLQSLCDLRKRHRTYFLSKLKQIKRKRLGARLHGS